MRKPKKKTFYVLFDMSNGDTTKNYLWWFDKKKDAKKKYKEHFKYNGYVELSKPTKVKLHK
jgi:hypothetical protein